MTSPPSGPREGWYPDPEDPTHQRYWDGFAWTAHRTPMPGTTPAVPAAPAWGAAAPAAQETSSHATLALVLGVLSLVMCGLVTGIPAMIIGRRATREIQESGGRLGGDGLAQAGFITGLIGTLVSGLGLLFFLFALGAMITASGVST